MQSRGRQRVGCSDQGTSWRQTGSGRWEERSGATYRPGKTTDVRRCTDLTWTGRNMNRSLLSAKEYQTGQSGGQDNSRSKVRSSENDSNNSCGRHLSSSVFMLATLQEGQRLLASQRRCFVCLDFMTEGNHIRSVTHDHFTGIKKALVATHAVGPV